MMWRLRMREGLLCLDSGLCLTPNGTSGEAFILLAIPASPPTGHRTLPDTGHAHASGESRERQHLSTAPSSNDQQGDASGQRDDSDNRM